jgi:hypothetical protein
MAERVVCCLDLHVGVVTAPVGNRRAKIDADHSAFSVFSGTTLPRVQTHNRRDRFREAGLSVPLALTLLMTICSMPLTHARLSLAMRQRPRLTTQEGYRETTTLSVSTTVSAVCGCGGHRLRYDRVCLCRTDSQTRNIYSRRPRRTGTKSCKWSATSTNCSSLPRASNGSSSHLTLRRVRTWERASGTARRICGGGDANGRV